MTPKILVTGGAGYIGSHTVVELLDSGYQVVIVDNLSTSRQEMLSGIETICGQKPIFYQVDICDAQALAAVFSEQQDIKAVIHFAAFKAVGESVARPLKYYHNNLTGMINLLRAMHRFSVRDLIFSSSCTVYGNIEKLPATENSPVQPANSPYGNTKQICEEMISDTANTARGLKAVSLRYFNPIGAHHSALIGELPIGTPNNLMPFITQTAIGRRKMLQVFGDDYDTPDGTCVRDYLHVVDLARAHVLALERLLNKRYQKACEIFNLGSGHGYSVMEVIKSFEKVSGISLNYKIGGRRAGDVAAIYADPTLAEKELGWSVQRTLDQMTASAWAWEKAYAGKNNQN